MVHEAFTLEWPRNNEGKKGDNSPIVIFFLPKTIHTYTQQTNLAINKSIKQQKNHSYKYSI